MTLITRSITAVGVVLLAHAGYSVQEYISLQVAQHATAAQVSLPLDIRAEAVIATLVMVIGLVMGSDKLRPIQWHTWAGKIEREGSAGFLDSNGEVEKDFRGNPFGYLETRPGFVNVRKQRREFLARQTGKE